MKGRLALSVVGALLIGGSGTLVGQSEANVEVLAQLLAATDARRFDESIFRRALADRDSSVRREAALDLGRLRDPRAIPLLAPLLFDADSLVQTGAIFSLGLIGDTTAVPLLIARTRDPAPVSQSAAPELLTALARLGGGEAARFVASVMEGTYWQTRSDSLYLVQRAALEAWRLGADAPISSLQGLVRALKDDTRFSAVYSLVRLRINAAGPDLVAAVSDKAPIVRAAAVRALDRAYVDSTRLDAAAIGERLVRAANDADVGVRAQALRTLATYHNPGLAPKILPLLQDPVPSIQVQAAATLGALGGSAAASELTRIVAAAKGSFSRRREALLSLARLDTAAFAAQSGNWASGADWRQRAAAAAGWAIVNPRSLTPFLSDPDPRVIATTLEEWGDRVRGADSDYVAACRRLAKNPDAAVRAVAAGGIARAESAGDIPLLVEMYRRASRDSFPDAALSALAGLVAISKAGQGPATGAEHEVIAQLGASENYVIRRWAEENWPRLADAWGPAYPLVTHRTMEDYRDVVRRYETGLDTDRYPTVKVEVEQLGPFEIELFGADAPLTVASFVRLMDAHYFDGQRFHRVIPNFVVQAGDPRGDGWGGPGELLRDELNLRRYGTYYVGMALSGPDTGGSQWFVTLSPQPHLDGSYTVFGRVTSGMAVLLKITEGDRIRSIHR